MPKKVQCRFCSLKINSTNMARHLHRHHQKQVEREGIDVPMCCFCGKKQTHQKRHIWKCKLSRLNGQYSFRGQYGDTIKGRGPEIHSIMRALQLKLPLIRIGGDNALGKTECVKHIMKNFTHQWFDGIGGDAWVEKVAQSNSKILVVDPCLSPEKAKEHPDKILLIVSDIERPENPTYLIYFRQIVEKPKWIKEILGD